MIGDTYTSDGIDFEVIWSGGEGLIPDRVTKTTGFWTPPKRLYNKKSAYWLGRGAKPDDSLDKPGEPAQTQLELEFEGEDEQAILCDD